MRKLIAVLGIIGAIFLAILLVGEVKKPATGTVEVEVVEVETVEVDTVEVEMPEPQPIPDPEPMPEPEVEEPVFVPLKWNGKRMAKFAKDNGGVIITIDGVKYVKIGNAYYFKKGKDVYVRIKNQIISIS